MSNDYSELSEQLANDTFAQEIAAAEAVRRMTPEQQAAALTKAVEVEGGLKVRIASPHAAKPIPRTVQPLEIYRAADLYGKRIERTPMIVPNLLPVGLTVLAGAQKRGKSWLALSLAVAVSGGTKFLGMQCAKAPVLYIDLESRQYRIQDRLGKIVVGAAPKDLYITHSAELIGDGLFDQLEGWIKTQKPPAVIIIDTLGRVKGGGKKSSDNAYDADTKMFGSMQKWAMDHSSAIILVHHLRKGTKDSDDWFDRINGSLGLTGVADAVWGLGGKRGDAVSRLMVVGRDIDGDYEMAIRFDGGRWLLENNNSDDYEEYTAFANDATVRGIYQMMQMQYDFCGTLSELQGVITDLTDEPFFVPTKDMDRSIQRFGQRMYDELHILANWIKKGNRRVLHLRNKAPDATQQVEMQEEGEHTV